MTIIRDGIEIELTGMEENEIYRKVKRDYLIEDIKSKAEDMEYDLSNFTDEDWERFADHAERAIENDCIMWDNYWDDIDYALEHI